MKDTFNNKGPRVMKTPAGDTHPRLTCPECDFVHYNNPKPVAVAIVADDAGRILMCRRAIDPRKGYWTLPGGFMERGETLQEGAARETLEEAGATIDVGALIAIFQTPDKSVIMFFFRATLAAPDIAAGPESLEAKMTPWNEIPWNDLAFPAMREALLQYDATRNKTDVAPLIKVMPPSGAPKP